MIVFNSNFLPDEIPRDRFEDNQTKVIPVAFLQQRDNEKALEDKLLHLKILSITNGGTMDLTVSPRFGPKRQKLSSRNCTYYRYILAADMANPPNCVGIFIRSANELSQVLKLTRGDCLIGMDVYVFEPDTTDESLGKTLPIVNLRGRQLIPLKLDSGLVDTEKTMRLPNSVGQTNYFVLKNRHVHLRRASVASDPSCTGIQCDRQKPKGGCTCTHLSASNSFVLNCDVNFNVPAALKMDASLTVMNFRSYRTTSLFFKDAAVFASMTTMEDQQKLVFQNRKRITEMVDWINENDGWTIVGWFKLGETTDAANENERVETHEVTVHISYLFPTGGYDTIDDPEFQALKIEYNHS